jgi:hypothetical protein
MILPRPFRREFALGLTLVLGGWWPVAAVEPAAPDSAEVLAPATADEIDRTLAALDEEEFSKRGKAQQRLERWIEEPRLASFLSDRLMRLLHAPETSFEVRARVEALAKGLPESPQPPAAGKPLASEIIPLLDRLNSDSSAERDGAQRRIRLMLRSVELISPLWSELKQRASAPGLTATGRRELEPLLDEARRAWLMADPASVPLPEISDEQINAWVDSLAEIDETDSLGRFRRDLAERELLDATARDDMRPRVLTILERRIAVADESVTVTLRQIVDFSKPAMAAEVWGHELGNWEHRQHQTVQYLILGLPQFNEMAQRATHFDHIDETTAHCVSGNSLAEGDYPVRIAIPHPDATREVMFHLTNLPTPRRRLAFEYQVQRDEGLRLREISQRTLDDFVARQTVLSEQQVVLLAQLDPRVVSSFVGPYFRAVPNRPLVTTNTELQGQLTVHGGICHMMTRVGTREAMPAVEELARSGRLEPTYESPYQIAWIAALTIAERDPWPGVDDWLAKLVDQKTPLVSNLESPPELGASAAAVLLNRHGASTRPFGLVTTGEAATERLRFVGFRFSSDRDRQDVTRWWEKQKGAIAASATP